MKNLIIKNLMKPLVKKQPEHSSAIVLLLFAVLFLISACVSIQLPTESNISKKIKYSNIQMNPPSSPFELKISPHADQLWVHSKTLNSISYLTLCPADQTDLEKSQLQSLVFLKNIKKVSLKTHLFNQEPSIEGTYTGFNNNLNYKVRMLSFFKHNCEFTLTYIAQADNFDLDSEQFENFKSHFIVRKD